MRFLKALKDARAQRRRITCSNYFDHVLPLLLTLLLRQLCFYFRLFEVISLAISKIEFKDRKITIGFFS